MVIDERYLNNLMFLLACSHNPVGLSDDQIREVKEKIPVVLQQGRAILDRTKKKLDKRFTVDDEVGWEDFCN